MNRLEDLIKQLPWKLQEEVKDFTEFLLEKQLKKQRKKPKFDWAGVMKDLRSEYTSVELQHKISELRIGKK
ncbi:MAG: DUF2281 domain-containing protein [Candidatus Brocadiaceae bacterium]|nr:DUF2281 domain-containing protein [Candidatus Brocadiaceae bacterium]